MTAQFSWIATDLLPRLGRTVRSNLGCQGLRLRGCLCGFSVFYIPFQGTLTDIPCCFIRSSLLSANHSPYRAAKFSCRAFRSKTPSHLRPPPGTGLSRVRLRNSFSRRGLRCFGIHRIAHRLGEGGIRTVTCDSDVGAYSGKAH